MLLAGGCRSTAERPVVVRTCSVPPDERSWGPLMLSTTAPVSGRSGLVRSFHGLDGFDQRFANNGNQFSVEPPD